jgi:hypothetical protein
LRHPAVHRRARRCVHTAEFKEEERRFPEFQVAKTALKAFVERKRYAGHFLPNTKG